MSHRLFIRTGATVAAAALAALATGPAFAAAPVAQSSAVALVVGLAGQGADSGKFVAINDGKTETTSGNNQPAIGVVSGQNLITTGTLAQDAATSVVDKKGHSEACSGLAGPGATLAGVGNGASCLTGGSTLAIKAGNIDLGAISLTSGALKIPGINVLGDVPGLSDALDAVSGGLRTLLTTIGDPSIDLTLGAVTSSCTADPGTASGTAAVVNAKAAVTLPAGLGTVNLLSLPANPGPNTHVVTDLSDVVELVQSDLNSEVDSLVSSNVGPLVTLINGVRTALGMAPISINQIIDSVQSQVTDVVGPALAPLEQNVLDITLNKQTKPAADSIEVTALDAQVLPAARAFVGSSLVNLEIGQTACGPNSRIGTTTTTTTTTTTSTTTTPTVSEGTPTEVKSGIGSLEDAPTALAMAGLAGLVLVGTGAGVVGFRRSLRQH